ncbi:hypothetical protein N658DRAFT_521776 [Parathielavia hyrcaniae]|uniref:50S ribosomal protein L34, chloroplastic n=1 Tax=Parathielavia hyrcaniae TaxID=113614 RepID=A0AAN6T4N8_9PEZI|nr:hypothetical protein N658DRAFT_521776 [Parathielavia hyrcaniae]
MSRVSLQSPLLQAALRRPTAELLSRCTRTTTTVKSGAARSLSHLPTLRPILTPTSAVFRAPNQALLLSRQQQQPTAMATNPATGEALDLLPKTSITAHPALAGCASQIRCGPRPTMSNASRLIQKRRHGFLSRIRTQGGRKTLMRRKLKGRKRLSA